MNLSEVDPPNGAAHFTAPVSGLRQSLAARTRPAPTLFTAHDGMSRNAATCCALMRSRVEGSGRPSAAWISTTKPIRKRGAYAAFRSRAFRLAFGADSVFTGSTLAVFAAARGWPSPYDFASADRFSEYSGATMG